MFFSLTLLVLVSALVTHLKGEETSNLQKVARLQSFLLDLKNETFLENVTIKASSLVWEFAEFNNYTQMYLTELTNQRARNTSATGEDLAKQMRNQLYILSVLKDKLKDPLSTEENKLQTSILQASHDILIQFVTVSNVLLDKYDVGKNMTMKYSVEGDLVLQRTKRAGCYRCPPPYDPPYNPPHYNPPPYNPPPYNPPYYKPPY